MPNANRMTIGIMAIMAEEEGRMISKRTKDALAALAARGKKLGGIRYRKADGLQAVGSAESTAIAVAAKQARADERAAQILPTIKKLQEAGAVSLRAIAAGLNEQGIPTARGDGVWSAVQVARILAREC
jgi:DNA invertase Pin-like site-specific DNA recombinase